jgi:hypothetical protein
VRTMRYIYDNAGLSQEVIDASELGRDPDYRELHARVGTLNGRGKVTFLPKVIADVECSTDQFGRLWVTHATGYPGWHPILLLHPPGPYRLVMDDGHETQICFRNLDGLVEVANIVVEGVE